MATLVGQSERGLMPAPPFTILASLTVWGWQNEFLLFAAIMGIILELPHFISWRIDFTDKDINQIVDLSSLIFFLTVVYVFINYGAHSVYKILELLPFVLFLVLLTQRYNHANSIKTSSLFISIRRTASGAGDDMLYDIDISMPYVFVCLISASAGYKQSELFFILVALIVACLLWRIRPEHFSVYRWLLTLSLVLVFAFITQIGIKSLHRAAESFIMTLFEHYGWRSRDSERSITAIGSIGRLKLSDATIIRIKSRQELPNPVYLRETSYTSYEYGIWSNPPIDFDIIGKQPDAKIWKLNTDSADQTYLDFGLYMQYQSAIIPAPATINSLLGQDLVQVESNHLGAIRIDARTGWINYRTGLSDNARELPAPGAEDLFIFDKYKGTFERLATELSLYSKTPAKVIQTVAAFFANNFYYSLSQNQRYPQGTYLERFLFENRRGHCEYFATATTLLLREAGIPARYTIGYVASEYSAWQDTYLVRGRDAHSWVQYYLDGKWQRLDTTPSIWVPLEAKDSTFLEPLIDIFSWLRYKISSEDIEGQAKDDFDAAWLLAPLMLYLAWNFSRKGKVKNKTTGVLATRGRQASNDSPLYALVARLEKQNDVRKPGETLRHWIKRILPDKNNQVYLELVALHNSYRFNPAGNKQQEMEQLTEKLKQVNLQKI